MRSRPDEGGAEERDRSRDEVARSDEDPVVIIGVSAHVDVRVQHRREDRLCHAEHVRAEHHRRILEKYQKGRVEDDDDEHRRERSEGAVSCAQEDSKRMRRGVVHRHVDDEHCELETCEDRQKPPVQREERDERHDDGHQGQMSPVVLELLAVCDGGC